MNNSISFVCPKRENLKRDRTIGLVIFFAFLFINTFVCSVFAGQSSDIELVDGGIIRGEIISHRDGVYVVRSATLGTLRVNESDIRLIRPNVGSPPKQKTIKVPGGSVSPEIQALQKSMMNNKEIMDLIQSLQQAPEMQELLKSPDIIKAIQSGDISALMSNPKFIRLMENPKVKEIQKKVLTPDAVRK